MSNARMRWLQVKNGLVAAALVILLGAGPTLTMTERSGR